jgi:hypothetical protein
LTIKKALFLARCLTDFLKLGKPRPALANNFSFQTARTLFQLAKNIGKTAFQISKDNFVAFIVPKTKTTFLPGNTTFSFFC